MVPSSRTAAHLSLVGPTDLPDLSALRPLLVADSPGPVRSDLDLRYPVSLEDLNSVLVRLAGTYEKTFGLAAQGAAILFKDADHKHCEPILREIRELRLVEGPFLHSHTENVDAVVPGIYAVERDPRFMNVLLAFVCVATDSFGVTLNSSVVALGPDASLSSLAAFAQGRQEEFSLPKIQYTWEDAILPGDLGAKIRHEIDSFLGGQSLYQRHRLPWKRGLLLCGEPGNGKTHTIRIIASQYRLPVSVIDSKGDLDNIDRYVATREDRHGVVQPRLVVMEDIDRIVTEEFSGGDLAKFLNALDGYGERDGMLLIATCNRADLLDPAIRLRPSRFDRIFEFPSPDAETRLRYLTRMLGGTAWDLVLMVEKTEKFSLAFLKELTILCFDHEYHGGQPTKEVAAEFVARLKRHMTLGRKKIGIQTGEK